MGIPAIVPRFVDSHAARLGCQTIVAASEAYPFPRAATTLVERTDENCWLMVGCCLVLRIWMNLRKTLYGFLCYAIWASEETGHIGSDCPCGSGGRRRHLSCGADYRTSSSR